MHATSVSGRRPLAFLHLFFGLAPDHRLEVAYQLGIGVRSRDRPDNIEGLIHIGDPVPKRFIHRIFECARARGDRNHFGTK